METHQEKLVHPSVVARLLKVIISNSLSTSLMLLTGANTRTAMASPHWSLDHA